MMVPIEQAVDVHHCLYFVGACDKVESRSDGLEFDSQCWPSVEVSGKLHIPAALVHPAIMGTLSIDPRLDQ